MFVREIQNLSTKVTIFDNDVSKIIKAVELSGKPNILYYRDSTNGKVIAAENNKISDLNKELHSNDWATSKTYSN